jgi:hypothetical protein
MPEQFFDEIFARLGAEDGRHQVAGFRDNLVARHRVLCGAAHGSLAAGPGMDHELSEIQIFSGKNGLITQDSINRGQKRRTCS